MYACIICIYHVYIYVYTCVTLCIYIYICIYAYRCALYIMHIYIYIYPEGPCPRYYIDIHVMIVVDILVNILIYSNE